MGLGFNKDEGKELKWVERKLVKDKNNYNSRPSF